MNPDSDKGFILPIQIRVRNVRSSNRILPFLALELFFYSLITFLKPGILLSSLASPLPFIPNFLIFLGGKDGFSALCGLSVIFVFRIICDVRVQPASHYKYEVGCNILTSKDCM